MVTKAAKKKVEVPAAMGMRVEGDELPARDRRTEPLPKRGKTGPQGPSRPTRDRLAFLVANAGRWCRLIECELSDHPEYRRMLSLGTSFKSSGNYAGCEFAVRTTGGKRVLFGRYVPTAGA